MLFFQNSAFNSTKVEVLFFSVGIKQPQNCFVALSFALSMSLSSRGKSAPELALSSSSRRVHTGRWSAALRQGCLAPWSDRFGVESIFSARRQRIATGNTLSAGALGMSAALRRRFRVRCEPGVTQQSSLKEPVGDGGFFDTAPRVRIHWQT